MTARSETGPTNSPSWVPLRRSGDVSDAACQSALTDLGFSDPVATCSALDQLLLHEQDDHRVHGLLTGCSQSADPGRALYNTSRLLALHECPPCPVPSEDLARFMGASQHMADLLLARPALLATLGQPFEPNEVASAHLTAGASEDPELALRQTQQQHLLSIAWADLILGLDVEQVTILLSCLADAIITGAVLGLGAERYFAVIALGKLGGFELNYSSDIDLIFVRPDSATDQVSADNVARRLIKLLSRQTPDGHLYRVDMRLRPEGGSGLLTRTVSTTLDYYDSRGRPWERQMLTKARVVSDSSGAGDEMLRGSRHWILSSGLDAAAVRQFKRLKTATEAHYASQFNDIKQAPGGIRDIETIVQFLALVHAAHNPWLICNATLHGLERLRVAHALSSLEAAKLRTAYLFHRRVENLLQVMHRVQTHRLPGDLGPLSRLMGRRTPADFQSELEEHQQRVRTIFEHYFQDAFPVTEGPSATVSQLLLESAPDEQLFGDTLSELGFSDGKRAAQILLRAASSASRFLSTSPRLRSSFATIAPAILERLALGADPDAALDRFERMTRGVGAREILYARLAKDHDLTGVLCDLADGSPYLSDILVREPQLFDAFQDALRTGSRGRRLRRDELIRQDAAHTNPWLELSDYKRLESLRIGVHDLQDTLTTPAVLSELSHLCIDILRHAYELVLNEARKEHGDPMTIRGISGKEPAQMIVLALGKVGGLEANYGSDADVVFVYSGDGETTRGVPNSVFFSRVAEDFIAAVSGSRGGPRLYKVDTRLRPEGAKGPLVTSRRAFAAYYRSPRAALFEQQALLKGRVVAGGAGLGQQVVSDIRKNLRKLSLPADLATQMREMRAKIEAAAHGHDLKRGTGGMVDIEQLTQFLQLRSASRHPVVLVQETPRALELLADCGVLRSDDALRLRDTYLFFRRIETRLQIALGLDTKIVPDEGPALRSLALRLGYADSADGDAGHSLLADLDHASTATRTRYEHLVC
ncbi:MAG: glutamate-ammonia-ligase adenylyltransferase [Pseudohongiellaceae bacterium]|jgi:glutamate-ammonia-ligase adenylyltransferase